MIVILSSLLMLMGAAFMFVAALGLLRMPDLLMRMHAATKAGTLGAGLLLLSIAVYFHDPGVTMRALAAIVFLFLTAPVAAHVIGRAAYLTGGLKLWEKTTLDELHGQYDVETRQLGSGFADVDPMPVVTPDATPPAGDPPPPPIRDR
jgi:multicomponent Na+:H+ antiporter subunit G